MRMMNTYPTANNNNKKKKHEGGGDGDGKVMTPGNTKIQQIRLYLFVVVFFSVMMIFNNARQLNPTMNNYKDSFLTHVDVNRNDDNNNDKEWGNLSSSLSSSLSSLSSSSPIDKDKNITVINGDVDVDVDVDRNDNNKKEGGTSSSSLSSSLSPIDGDKNITAGSTSDMVVSNIDEEKINNDDNDNDNDNDDDDDDDHRPWLIVHVGPPKTATTTIQDSFEEIAAQLAKDDNYYYIGQTLKTKKSERIKSLGPTMNDKANITVFQIKDFIYEHSKEFLDKLRYYHDNKCNVIISSEFYTSKLFHQGKNNIDEIFNGIFLTKNNTQQKQLQQQQESSTEKSSGFRIKIVVGYRHFFEWLPSYYHQHHLVIPKDTPNKQTKISNDNTLLYPYHGYVPGVIAYVEWFLRDLVQYDPPAVDKNKNNNSSNDSNDNNNNNKRNNINHTAYDGIFISSKKKEIQKKVHGSIYSYLMWSSKPGLYDRVEIFDMHQQEYNSNSSSMTTNNNKPGKQQNLFANFVCQMLPSASNTCRHLVEETDDESFRKRIRKTDTKKLLSQHDKYRFIQASRMKKLSLTPEFKSSHNVTIPTGKELTNGIQRWLNNDKNKQQNITGLSKRCLKSESTQKLKVASWNFLLQQALLVRMHNKSRRKQQQQQRRSHSQSKSKSNLIESSSTKTDHLILSSQYPTSDDDNNNNDNDGDDDDDDDSWLMHIKAEHDKSFDEYVSTGAFCEIDIEKLFSNEEFINTVIFPPRPQGSVIKNV
jgi:hypothetical protein